MSGSKSINAADNHDSGRDQVAAANPDGTPGAAIGEQNSICGWVDVARVQGPSDPAYVAGWWAEAMSTERWFDPEQPATPSQAALVLCRINPQHYPYAEQYRAEETAEKILDEIVIRDTETGEIVRRTTVSEAYRELRLMFDGVRQADPGANRTMAQWLEIAQQRGLVYHQWVDEWLEAVAQIARSTSGPKPRAQHHDLASSRPDGGQPLRLRIGPNSRKSIAAYVGERSSELYRNDASLTKQGIATTIATELKNDGYSGERGEYLTAATIVRLMPPGLTGGRAKNGRKSPAK
ncbi:hypothetical protein SAMN05446927_4600 [Caballeronia arationis]|uniref:Uncharacterized protein n=1 Tax=Caballeronia arationis TaxID=1777142 RepID=A0A7Z7I9C9_9BURK|nr:hypothetical protein [Caballeronia arationis]SOE81322.1 hypothetical protein SAMN05446927_4600 [Caballeronia arationis]